MTLSSIITKRTIYVIFEHGAEATGPTKIGIAVNAGARRRQLQCGNPRRLRTFQQYVMDDLQAAVQVEFDALGAFPGVHGGSEWVDAPPAKVCEVIERAALRRQFRAVPRRALSDTDTDTTRAGAA